MVTSNANTRNGEKPLRVYTLADGTKWTAVDIQNKIKSKWNKQDVAITLVRARLDTHTDPDKIFAKPILTKPRIFSNQSERKLEIEKAKKIDREMMNLALRNI